MSISTGVPAAAVSTLASALTAAVFCLPFVAGAQSTPKKPVAPVNLSAPKPAARPAVAARPVAASIAGKPASTPVLTKIAPVAVNSPASPLVSAGMQPAQPTLTRTTAAPLNAAAPITQPGQPSLTRSSAATAPLAATSPAGVSAATGAPTGNVTSSGALGAAGTTTAQPQSSIAGFLNSGSTTSSSATPSSATYGTSNLASVAGSETGSRSANFAAGLGTFEGYGWTLTAFGCFRANTRVFCDFDLSDTQSRQVGLNIFSTVGLILDGGRIVARHNAFFLGQDGTQFTVAATSPGNPVRYVMEYDDVSPSFTAITLANGGNRISNVGVTAMDATQAPGTVPARGAAATSQATATDPATGAPAAAPAGALDKASDAITNATTTKQKLGGMWQQMKQASQTH